MQKDTPMVPPLIRFTLSLVLGFMFWVGIVPPKAVGAIATSANQNMVSDVRVDLGTEAGELTFAPDQLTFQAGRRYKLILHNPSPQKHYFTAKDFADGIWTQKVEAGNVEIKGAIHELELKPGAEAEWFFTPLKAGTYELHCSIAGHTEAGMRGILTIAN
jgi:uncharacterized cupredoxin-like copper-binding protein